MRNNIKVIRKNKKVSKNKLSDLTGIPVTTLSSYESYRRRAPLTSILKIAAALEVNPKDLLSEEGLKELEGTVLLADGDWSIEEALKEDETSNWHRLNKPPAKVAACSAQSRKVVGHAICEDGNIQGTGINNTLLEKFNSLSSKDQEDVLKYIDFLKYREKTTENK